MPDTPALPASPYAPFYPILWRIGVGFAVLAVLAVSLFYALREETVCIYPRREDLDLALLASVLSTYEAQNGAFPSSEQGLSALVTRPTGKPQPRNWKLQMSELPEDSWGNSYVYEYPGKRSGKPYDLYSKGKDQIAETADDIGNWPDPTIVGLRK